MWKAACSGRVVLQRAGRLRDLSLGSLQCYCTGNKVSTGPAWDRKSQQCLHVTARTRYAAAKPIPLPSNVEDIVSAERVQFSPRRERDLMGPMIASREEPCTCWKHWGATSASDPYLQGYDHSDSVNLTCAMQSNVPQPFSSEGKATHLNMPRGQWDRGDRWVSQDMQELHWRAPSTRRLCSSAPSGAAPSGKERLKAAVRDYGATVVVFHVGISLVSLGGFYAAVSSGVDVAHLLSSLGLQAGQVAAGASTFVVAYAVHKVFAPARIAITLAAAPFIVRHLRSIGFLARPRT